MILYVNEYVFVNQGDARMLISKSSSFLLKISLVLAILASICFCFVGCGGLRTLPDGPTATDAVYGNGGLAVQKGDYLYFVNGYMDTSAVGDTNQYGKIDHSAIYRIKLVNGKVVETNPDYYDEDNNLVTDKTLALDNLDILVPKVAGFEYSNLYIFGDYLYYTTPNNLKDKNLTVQSDYLQFYRTKLNRSGANELLYTSEATNEDVSITMYEIEGTVYQIILDDEKLIVNKIKGSSVIRETISGDAHNASLPVYKNSTDVVSAIDKKIYYTQHSEEFSGTILYSYDLTNGQRETIFSNENITYEIINTSGDYLYYVKTDANPPVNDGKIYAMDINNNEFAISNMFVNSDGISEYHLVDSYLGKAIIYSNNSKTYLKLSGRENGALILSSDVVKNIVRVDGKYMYYIKDSNLYKVNYGDAYSSTPVEELVIPSGTTPKADIVNNFDVDGSNVFFLVKHGDHYYLHYVSYDSTVKDDNGNTYTHFVGKLLKEDIEE